MSEELEPTTGIIPRATASDEQQAYSESPCGAFRVRSTGYLRHGRKQRPDRAMFDLVGADTFLLPEALHNASDWHDSVIQRFRRNHQKTYGDDGPRFFVVNFVCPGNPNDINLILYFAEKPNDDAGWQRVINRFLEGDDDTYRRHRLKLLPMCAEGPWLVRKAIGRPALIAKKLDTTFRRGPGFLEATVDIGSSIIARQVQSLVGSTLRSLVIDLGFTIEGHDDSELPERLIGGCRLQRMDIASFDFSVKP